MDNTPHTFTQPFPIVGTKEYKEFRQYLKEKEDYNTRMRMTTLKDEYLIQYWSDFLEKKHTKVFIEVMKTIDWIM